MLDGGKDSSNRRARDAIKSAQLRALLDRHKERFRAAAGAAAPAVAREVHGAIDEVLRRDRAKSAASGGIRCGKGCSHCCHGPVEIWPQEAALLIEVARASGIELDRARLERQSGYTADTWRQQPAADRACGFLGADGACRIYDARPNACRKLLVTSDPALCDAAKHPPDAVENWFSWEAEIMESAALEVFGSALMPRLLLENLEKGTG